MASNKVLGCCRVFCCIFMVFVNILSILLGILFAFLGIILLAGSSVIQSFQTSMANSNAGGGNETVTMFGGHVNIGNYYSSLSVLSGSMAGLLIALGIVIVVVSCIGCFGACIGVPACLIIYVVCVAVLFLGQVIVIVIWFANSNVYKQSSRNSLQNQVSKFRGDYVDNTESVSLSLIQAVFGCCGVDNGTDFLVGSPNWDRSYAITDGQNQGVSFNLTYPVTCCKFHLSNKTLVDPYCPYNRSADPAVSNWNIGCHSRIWQVMETEWRLDNFFYALCGILGLEILLIFGALLICTVKRQEIQETRRAHSEVEYKMVQQKGAV